MRPLAIELCDPDDAPIHYGYLSLRYGGSAVTAFLDGHADTLPEKKLRDMRHWADQADSPHWKLQPPF
jgi:prepilin-type processing-associated H-X9-DG protein